MKKVVIFFLIVTFILGITGCDNNENLSNASSSLENNIQNGEVLNQTEEKNWSEQDIIAMFSSIAKEEWVYEECVVIPDYASDRVGAVLFQDK